jgi:8-oxo-dGTP diphosphatase
MADADGRAEYHYVLIDYICRVTGGDLAPATDVSHAAWASKPELPQYDLTEGTLGVILRAWDHAGQ